MNKVINMGKVNRVNVCFWLKPYLHDFVLRFTGTDRIEVQDTNVIGCMALSILTPKNQEAYQASEQFKNGRKPLHGTITLRRGEAHGFNVASYPRFEFLVEHFFYHQLLLYVDQCIEAGMEQNPAIRAFLRQYDIDEAHVNEESLKKTIIRRRKRMEHKRAA